MTRHTRPARTVRTYDEFMVDGRLKVVRPPLQQFEQALRQHLEDMEPRPQAAPVAKRRPRPAEARHTHSISE